MAELCVGKEGELYERYFKAPYLLLLFKASILLAILTPVFLLCQPEVSVYISNEDILHHNSH